jgi:hypothetical protein
MLHFHKVRGSRISRDRDKLANIGSHDSVINATFDVLFTTDPKQAEYFNRQITKLKSERVNADYKEHYFDQTRSIVAYEIAKRLISILAETLNTN